MKGNGQSYYAHLEGGGYALTTQPREESFCEECQRVIPARRRSDTLYCSNRCKTRAKRKRARAGTSGVTSSLALDGSGTPYADAGGYAFDAGSPYADGRDVEAEADAATRRFHGKLGLTPVLSSLAYTPQDRLHGDPARHRELFAARARESRARNDHYPTRHETRPAAAWNLPRAAELPARLVPSRSGAIGRPMPARYANAGYGG